MHEGLGSALDEAAAPEIRAVVLTGAGRGFCAGQDFREFSELPGGVGQALEETYHPNVRRMRALEKPVIAAVNGPCARSGALARLRVRRAHRVLGSRASFQGSSGSGSCPMREARGSSIDCSASPVRSNGWSRIAAWAPRRRCLGARLRGSRPSDLRSGRRARRVVRGPADAGGRDDEAAFEHALTASLEDQFELEAAFSRPPRRPRTSPKASRHSSRSASRTSTAGRRTGSGRIRDLPHRCGRPAGRPSTPEAARVARLTTDPRPHLSSTPSKVRPVWRSERSTTTRGASRSAS